MVIFRIAGIGRRAWAFVLLLSIFATLAFALQSEGRPYGYDSGHETGYETENQNVLHPIRPIGSGQRLPEPKSYNSYLKGQYGGSPFSPSAVTNALQELHAALSTMQTFYFSLWLGKWTTAIDWTAAIMGTHVSAALSSLSHSLPYTMPGTFDKDRKLDVEAQMIENEINKYFTQSITYFFGEDHFAIRNQAYDDMLWVVLGWLEGIQFINGHSEMHYPLSSDRAQGESEWHGRQFAPAFAHRARIFYELASKGWDWKLCGGGMNWNPHTRLPYKNAITNELFISASIGMYLHFTGDTNCSPFMGAGDNKDDPGWKKLRSQERGDDEGCDYGVPRATYDPIYLSAAINGYKWLKDSGMKNTHGLYVDGFHIKDYGKNNSIGTGKCDERNEMVYTYNQGVLLSGLRGLWEGTGRVEYLEDAHELIRNVIRATGWTDTKISPSVSFSLAEHDTKSHHDGPLSEPESGSPSPENESASTTQWSGLGSHGILTELCDPYGTCSQNGQTFKGIFFHHLTTFCAPLPTSAAMPGKTFFASKVTAALHKRSCGEYAAWVVLNAQKAMGTRDTRGRFGTWWGAPSGIVGMRVDDEGEREKFHRTLIRKGMSHVLPLNAMDYRNHPSTLLRDEQTEGEPNIDITGMKEQDFNSGNRDLNDRGRGRTVETQGGGVAVVRAMWEFLRNYDNDDE
ncbi:Six-hairpin glycosidase [Lindgomyces ingoldianus]|uniref:Six-hairpin glycosidase n=1 Tax=Lindgomyces ingoldianus TaxID=673940 RepID=A0ACB6QEJ8_9PLEO|nr:Six-hairpin glycosidase [Lindgomyces ingoldianus]KAF2465339.1 Six-hairpin glycosidase [Lindgomyces ingoldianus]